MSLPLPTLSHEETTTSASAMNEDVEKLPQAKRPKGAASGSPSGSPSGSASGSDPEPVCSIWVIKVKDNEMEVTGDLFVSVDEMHFY